MKKTLIALSLIALCAITGATAWNTASSKNIQQYVYLEKRIELPKEFLSIKCSREARTVVITIRHPVYPTKAMLLANK